MEYFRVRKKDSGFTLVEVMLAAIISGIIALSIYMVFSQGIEVEKRLRKALSPGDDISMIVWELSRDLEHIRSYTISSDGKMFFEGKKDEITFLSSKNHRLVEIQYRLEKAEKTMIHREVVVRESVFLKGKQITTQEQGGQDLYDLVRTVKPFLKADLIKADSSDAKEMISQRVVEDGLKFFYLGTDDAGDQQWYEQWQKKGLPLAIRFDLTILRGETSKSVHLERDVFLNFTQQIRGTD